MKRNILGLTAILLATFFSAFIAKKTTSYYFIYKVAMAGSQNNMGSFETFTLTNPGIKPGADVLAWIKVEASSPEGPNTTEFNSTFTALNVTNSGTPSLNDEVEDHINLELQAD